MNNIITHLDVHAAARPGSTAFVILNDGEVAGQEISYAQLHASVKSLAWQLSSKQLEGKSVLLAFQDIPSFITAFLACQYCGIIAVPVSYPKGSKQVARLFAIIDDAQASAILCTEDAVGVLRETLPATIEIITTGNDIPDASLFAEVKRGYNEIAFIQYTSGSTGQPKGVVVTNRNLLHNQQLIQNTFECNEQSVILSWLPFHHDMGLIGNILHTIYIGCRCILMSPLHFMQRPARWLENISKYKATHSGGPNFAYDLAVEKIPAAELSHLDLSSWKVAYNGSEPVRAETLQRFSDHFSSAGFSRNAFVPCYGLAEATLLVSGSRAASSAIFIERELRGSKVLLSEASAADTVAVVSSGAIAGGMECRIILPENGKDCVDLQEGEICIAGESVTPGYWLRDNNDIFYRRNGKQFLRTGDLGFFYKGSLFVHGRLKEMLIIRGKNFYPYDIEAVVAASSKSIELNGVAVFSTGNHAGEFVIMAEVKRSQVKNIQAAEVIQSIDIAVAASFGISPYDIVLTMPLGIPRTTSGKLQRVKCSSIYDQNGFTIIASMRQLNETMAAKEKSEHLMHEAIANADYASIKKYLVTVIESKAGRVPAALPDEMTELTATGLDSLRAMELINTVNKDLNINIDASKVFQVNTLSGLINTIESMLWLKNKQPFGTEITI